MNSIYIANLGKYNEGKLVGKWLELPCTQKDLEKLFCEIKLGRMENGKFVGGYIENGMLYEEYAIHDTDLEYDFLDVNEYDNPMKISEQVELLDKLNDTDIKIVKILLDEGYTLEEAINAKDDRMVIFLDNTMNKHEALAYAIVDDIYGGVENVPRDILERYVDFHAMGRDLAYDYTIEGDIALSNQ